ncbi:ABC transporter permease [Paenibacillus spongiae]|uniref:ABC transporter permease n=1 Tax=Paenibacillus spongiae TaxID=2909671 RepID=A0ABY5SFX0_9BACL|nr:ABC transporter permease [Paenibacillus spongiae]UVI31632.1 ABC transporter permease [Paenibacillus spongiae]
MFDFLQLVRNENMKIYRRVRTWIMFGILIMLVLAISIVAKLVGDGDVDNWFMMSMETMVLFQLVTIFTVVVSADSVAGEFSTGTIKLLLIRPWSRSKILLSKYISLLMFALVQAVLLYALTFLANMLLFGYSGSGEAQKVFESDLHPFAYMLLYYFYQFLGLIIIVTMAFMLSTVFRSGGLAIGLSLFLLLGGSTIAGLLSMLDYAWVDYILFLHLNLTQYMGGSEAGGMTLGFSLGVLAAYYVVFIALTWLIFNKRDVAA